jgi:hypothetical protein
MAEEWDTLLRDNPVTRLLGITSLRAFEGCDSIVRASSFVRTAFLRLLHQASPAYDPFRDLQCSSVQPVMCYIRANLSKLVSAGYAASLRRSRLESPPNDTFAGALCRLQEEYDWLLKRMTLVVRPHCMKDPSFKPQPVRWGDPIDLNWSYRIIRGRDPQYTSWCDDTRMWLWGVGVVEEAAILLGNDSDYLLRLISGLDGELRYDAEPYALSIWPYAMQHRLPGVVGECARILPVNALPELVAEYVFGDAVREWLPCTAV